MVPKSNGRKVGNQTLDSGDLNCFTKGYLTSGSSSLLLKYPNKGENHSLEHITFSAKCSVR